MRRITSLICSATALLALCVSVSEGANITFLDTRAAFTGATTNLTTIDFEGIVPTNAAQNFANPAGLTASGVNFTTSGTGPFGTAAASAVRRRGEWDVEAHYRHNAPIGGRSRGFLCVGHWRFNSTPQRKNEGDDPLATARRSTVDAMFFGCA